MPFQRFIRWLMPQETRFYDLLERQAMVATHAAKALAAIRDGRPSSEVRASCQTFEHEGDAIVKEMLDALARTFVTPIDREDLQRLSKKLDDIADFINQAARDCVLYNVAKPTRPMLVMIDKLAECGEVLAATMPKLRRHAYQEILDACHHLSLIKKDGDTVFTEALNALFHDDAIDAKTILREKEVLQALEKAMSRCEQVAELLTGLAIKHA